jgi:diadenosine tetraphosphate (Ap4A) HIT family hydrolase
MLGYIIETKVKNFVREIKTKTAGLVNNCQQMTPFGFESRPIKGETAVTQRVKNIRTIFGYLQDAFEGLEEGESVMFSKEDNGDYQATIITRKDKTIEVNGTGDFLMRYNEMQREFNELNDKFNSHIQAYNTFVQTTFPAHVHLIPFAQAISATAPPPSAGTITVVPPSSLSVADITKTKHELLKTNPKQ